jgi:GTPase SAR1 family protein
MQLFLKGCGFYFDGTLDIINEETEELYSEQAQWNDTVKVTNLNQMDMFDSMDLQHAPNYYDTERNK